MPARLLGAVFGVSPLSPPWLRGHGRGRGAGSAAGRAQARLQRFPASVLLPLGDDGCSDEGTRLLRGLSRLQREGKVQSWCVHTCGHVCVRVLALCVTAGTAPGFVPLSQEGAAEALAAGAARAQGADAVTLVLHPVQGSAVPQGCPGSCAGPRVPGCWAHHPRGSAAWERQHHLQMSVLRRKSRLPARQTTPFVLSGV